MPGSRPTWYLTHEYVGPDPTCDLQKLQVAPFTVPLFLEGRPGQIAARTSGHLSGSAPHFVMATGAGLWRVTSYVMSLVMFGVLL
jgi:hypothetical protein